MMRFRTILFVLIVLFCAVPAFGQNGNFTGIVFGPSGRPISNPSITVCLATDATCTTGDVSLYSDSGALHPITNPFNGDGYGNYSFWTTAGSYKVTISGNGISTSTTTVAVPCLPTSTGCGGGGGGVSPPAAAVQFANPTVTGQSTASCQSNAIGVDSTTSPTVLNDTCSFSVGGPRPYDDVTSTVFGAKGDSSTNDAAGIQAALTASCATTTLLNGFPMHPAVVFPPGIYRVAQPQSGSTPVFTIPCSYLEIRGYPGGSQGQFANPTSSIVVQAGSTPNAAPIFYIPPGTHDVRFKDIAVTGYNEAYWSRSNSNITWDNAPMTVTGQTGLADNTPLKISNGLELWRINRSNAESVCGGGVPCPTTPSVIYTNETSQIGEATINSYIYALDNVDSGGGEAVIQRVTPNGLGAVLVVAEWDRDFLEETSTGFLTATNTSGVPMQIGVFNFKQDGMETYAGSTSAFLTLNDSQGSIAGVVMDHVGISSYAIQALAGHVEDYHVIGCNTICSTLVVDGNGNSLGTGDATERFGEQDSFSDNSYIVTSPVAGLASAVNASPTLSRRFCTSGVMYCSLGLDSIYGVLFGLGDANAYNVGLNQTVKQTLDVQFATLLPPTGFSGTATTGGSLSGATYYAQLWSTVNSNCTSSPTSAPINATGVLVGGSNNAVAYSWTVPITTPVTPTGYCIQIQTTPIFPGSIISQSLYISGAGTTSFTYTGQAFTNNAAPPANVMVSRHRFTENGLNLAGGVNSYTDTGVAGNTYVITTAPPFSSLPTGFQTCFFTANANTGASTLNVNSIGATAIKTASGSALTANSINANSYACVLYDGTNFELQGTSSGAGGGVSSFTGDGTLLSNSGSTGGVTATLANAAAHSVFGNFTGSPAGPTYSTTPTFAVTNLTGTGGFSITGNAATATALASLPTLCTTGQAPTGVLANGNATGCASIASGLTTQTNTVNNTSQSTLNLLNSSAFNGLTFTFTNTSAGNVQAGFSGTLGNAGLANSSVTFNGTSVALGASGNIPFEHNGSNNASLSGLNVLDSTADSVGLHGAWTNPSGIGVRLEISGGSYTGNAATATALASAPSLCSLGTFAQGILANGNATGCSAGSGTINSSSQYSLPYYSAAGSANTLSGVAAPTTAGTWLFGWQVPSSSAVAPTAFLAGIVTRDVTGTTSTDTILATDGTNCVFYETSVAVTVTLPTPTTLANAHFALCAANRTTGSTTAVTFNPSGGLTVNGNASLILSQGQVARFTVDVSGNWEADVYEPPLTTGTNITFSRTAYGLTINATSGGTVGSCATTNALALYTASTTIGCGNADFTYATHTLTMGASGILNLSAGSPTAGFQVPTAAGAAPTTDGFIAFNSTTHAVVSGSNGTTIVQAAAATGTGTSTTCTNQFFTVISAVAIPTCTTVTPAYAAGNTSGSGNFALVTSPNFTSAILAGTDNSVAGTLQLSNSAANAHNTFGSAATTSNTILGFATAPTTTDLIECVTSSTTCTLTDSAVAVANVVTNTTGNASAAQQVLVSAGANKTAKAIDFPQVDDVPAANCNNTTAGAGWSIGSGGTVTCRAGTNNLGGYIAITDTSSTFAQFALQIPEDWDTGTDPYIRFHLAYPGTDGGSSHTIIPQIKVSCEKGDGSTTDDVSFNAAHSSSTITLSSASANLFFATSNVQMNSTDMTGCVAGSMMIVQVGRATDTATSAANFYSATVTFPRLIAVQAN
jgi:hypothetical protein